MLAAEGDTVRFATAGVVLNGRTVPNSRPLPSDAVGRPLPPARFGAYVLAAGEVWLWSPYTPRSFDSRYYGPLRAGAETATDRATGRPTARGIGSSGSSTG